MPELCSNCGNPTPEAGLCEICYISIKCREPELPREISSTFLQLGVCEDDHKVPVKMKQLDLAVY